MGLGDFLDPGDIFGFQQDSRVGKANAAAKEAYDKAMETSNANRALYSQYLNKMNGTYGDVAGKYGDYLSNIENQEVYDPGQFSYDKDVNDFYSKAANQRVNQATNAITNSRANAGGMFSSDYLNELAAKQQALASEEWDKAYNRYNQDRSMALNEFSTNANLGNQRYQNLFNKNTTLLGQAQNAQDNVTNAYANYLQNLASQNNTDAQNFANYTQTVAGNNLSKKGLLGRILG
jgi:hypothetical protein